MSDAPRPKRHPWSATVRSTELISPHMVRLVVGDDSFAEFPDMPFTDHYVKIFFPPPGADYGMAQVLDHLDDDDREARPVTRTYTIRSIDRDRRELALDFVVHGTEGLAGPWAAQAKIGDPLSFRGPGGAWGPSSDQPELLLAGDESALPAIHAALDVLPDNVRPWVFVEVNDAHDQIEHPAAETTWLHRAVLGTPPGVALTQAVTAADLPDQFAAFVHGNAEMIRDLRLNLFVERGLAKTDVSISGYWRTGMTEDLWQSTKRDFMAAMEAAEVGAGRS